MTAAAREPGDHAGAPLAALPAPLLGESADASRLRRRP